ncbi:MAG: hypothetical protein LBG65_05525 [Puniceicoccales bacterium]|jgi:DNA-binding transcriptional regulator/RsmH inhibitor MraZ|nr:hypothetical protein [Puniceicoccales bacterium]
MSAKTSSCEFLGKTKGKLDDRNRITIPAEWRSQIKNGGKYLVTYDCYKGVIRIYAPESTEKILAATENPFAGGLEAAEVLEEFIAGSELIEFDSAGRILLSEDLLALANITKEVRFSSFGRSGFTIASDNPPVVDRQSEKVRRYRECMRLIFPETLAVPPDMSTETARDLLRGMAANKSYHMAQPAPPAAQPAAPQPDPLPAPQFQQLQQLMQLMGQFPIQPVPQGLQADGASRDQPV